MVTGVTRRVNAHELRVEDVEASSRSRAFAGDLIGRFARRDPGDFQAFKSSARHRSVEPARLGIKATVLWLYSNDVKAMSRFYEDSMGFGVTVDQGWTLIHATSPSGFIGPVDGAKGMHTWTQEKAVMVSLFTTDLEAWFAHLKNQSAFELREEGIVEETRAGAWVFVGTDPDGYLIEFDEFFEAEGNEALLAALTKS